MKKRFLALIIALLSIISLFSFGCNKNSNNNPSDNKTDVGQDVLNPDSGDGTNSDVAAEEPPVQEEPVQEEPTQEDEPAQEEPVQEENPTQEEPTQEEEPALDEERIAEAAAAGGFTYNEADKLYEKDKSDAVTLQLTWTAMGQSVVFWFDYDKIEHDVVFELSCDGGVFVDNENYFHTEYSVSFTDVNRAGFWRVSPDEYNTKEIKCEPFSRYIQIIAKADGKVVGYGIINVVYTGEKVYPENRDNIIDYYHMGYVYFVGSLVKFVELCPEANATEEQVKLAIARAIEANG